MFVCTCSAGCGRTGTLIGIDIAKIMLLSKVSLLDTAVDRYLATNHPRLLG